MKKCCLDEFYTYKQSVTFLQPCWDTCCKQGDIHKSVTCMWVLSCLKANLQHHITYRCTVRKCGTLVFRPNIDLIPSLQDNVEAKAVRVHRKVIWNQHEITTPRWPQPQNTYKKGLVWQKLPFEPDMLAIDKFIDKTDSQVWSTICLLDVR